MLKLCKTLPQGRMAIETFLLFEVLKSAFVVAFLTTARVRGVSILPKSAGKDK